MNKRGGYVCAYKNCCSATSRGKANISFFRFPRDPTRCTTWIQASGREDLVKKDPIELYKNYRICNLHFPQEMFLNDLKNRLQPVAVPIASLKRKLTEPSLGEISQKILIHENIIITESENRCVAGPSTSSDINPSRAIPENLESSFASTQTPLSMTSRSPRKLKYRQQVKTLRNKLGKLENKLEQQQKSNLNSVSMDQLETTLRHFLPEDLAKFVMMQARQNLRKPQGRRYHHEFKQFCLTIYFMSPKAYRFLAKTFFLPTKRTLQKMTSELKFAPGLQDLLFESLKIKVKCLKTIDKQRVLCIDEMSLKANLFYNISQDEVLGFEDIGNGKSFLPACNAAVAMIRGLSSNWKQPIGYFLLHTSCSSESLKDIIFKSTIKLKAIGINIVGLVTDMGSNFIQLANSLQVTPEKPFFYVGENKIAYIFDPPHLIKATRNNLMKYSYQCGDKVTSWKHIEAFYEHDKKLQCRMAPKLSDSHINPSSFERMKVKLATQVLSATVSAGLNTYVSLGALPADAIGTSECIQRFDNLHDMFNSSSVLSSKKYGQAFQGKPFQMNFIMETLSYLDNVKIISGSGKDVTNTITSIKCWKISINGLICLWESLKIEGFHFLLTRRVNQDALENFFGVVRQQGGNSFNPTPNQFYNASRKMFLILFFHSGTENCAEDFDSLLARISEIPYTEDSSCVNDITPALGQTDISLSTQHCDYRNIDIPEKNAISYICGYLLKKCLCVHTCPVCEQFAKVHKDLDCTRFFCYFKAYENFHKDTFGNLCMPGEEFIMYISILEDRFHDNFQTLVLEKKVVGIMMNSFTEVPFQHPCVEFPLKFLIKLYCRMRLSYSLKFMNREFKSQKGHRKSIILQHN